MKREVSGLRRARRRYGLRAVAAALAVCTAAMAAAAAAAKPPAAQSPPWPATTETRNGDSLERVHLTLGHDRPYRYTLAYRGPLLPFRGHICYGFAGYNETCVDPRIEWLTPATDIELYAPGGVPRDLLEGYVMEVRYPALSPRTFRYPLGTRPDRPADVGEPRVP